MYQGADMIQTTLDSSLRETAPTDAQPLSFKATIMAFRNLHPRSGKSETTALRSADHTWRKQCLAALKLTDPSRHNFGGRFKVHLAVAATSDRCYRLILEIMDSFSVGQLKDQKHTKVNSCLFLEIVSFKDEAFLYRKLTELRNGEISKEEFNIQLKRNKQAIKGTEISQETAAVLALKEQLKEKDRLIEELRTQNQFLRQELDKMKVDKSQQLQEHQDEQSLPEAQRIPESDVYAFTDDDDCDLQVTLVQDLLLEETAQEHHEVIPSVESPELPVISYKGRPSQKGRKNLQSSSNLRSLRKKGPEKASMIAETEEMAESYLRKRRQNNEISLCKFDVGMIVEALEDDGFWYKAKVLTVQREKVEIHWTGYSLHEWLPTKKIRFELKTGDEFEAPRFVHRAARYPGHVQRVDGEYILVQFNDRTKKRLLFKYIEKKTTQL